MRVSVAILFILLIFFIPGISSAQNRIQNVEIKKIGTPFISNFDMTKIGGGMQNWSATQDARGIMYFGNNEGLLEFDGNSWRKYQVRNNSIVRSVFTGSDGNIYFGAYNLFGKLTANVQGELQLVYLSDQIQEELNFGEIWRILETSWGIVFQSFSSVFVYNKQLSTLTTSENINFSHQLNDGRILVGHNEKGLMELTKTGLVELSGGSIFANQSIPAIFNLPDGNMIVSTNLNGFYLYNGKTFTKWGTLSLNEAVAAQIYCGLQLSDYLYAIGTIRNGLYIFDQSGNILQHINKDKGMQNNSVLNLYVDNETNLWACLDNGIDLIEINSPVTQLFPEGEFGTGYVTLKHKGLLYFGTNQGLFSIPYSKLQSNSENQPQPISGTEGQVWNLQLIHDHLICGHHNGAYEIQNNSAKKISDELGCWKFLPLPENNHFIIGGTYTGLILLQENKATTPHFKFIRKIDGFDISCREFEIDNKGWIWVSHGHNGVYKIKLNDSLTSVEALEFYTTENGLPSNSFNSIFKIKGSVHVSTIDGIYSYSPRRNFFIRDDMLSGAFGSSKVNKVFETEAGNIWFFQDGRLGVLRANFNGTYNQEIMNYGGLEGNFFRNYEHIFQLQNKAYIISTREGFIHFDETNAGNFSKPFDVEIREVKSLQNMIIFAGNHLSDQTILASKQAENAIPFIPFKNRDLHFSASAITYSNQNKIEFSFWLEGHDDNWSEWSKQNYREYHALLGGDYTLHVKARNNFRVESRENTFSFKVGKPWYWNYFSLVIYLGLFILVTYLSVRTVNARFEKQGLIMREKQTQQLIEKEKQFEHERLIIEQEISQLKNDKLNSENERSKAELENKSKELASILMKISYTNDLINRTRTSLQKVSYQMVHEDSKKQIQRVIKNLEQELDHKEDWKKFEVHFDQVHENFIHELRNQFPELTPKDLKMAAYIRMNLSTKEIAELLNLSHRGVETSRYRLRKKVNLDKNANLTDFFMDIK
ncbi:MAG: triple tyrosine motif-containing protein [Prolixibacteraceae bacterium]